MNKKIVKYTIIENDDTEKLEKNVEDFLNLGSLLYGFPYVYVVGPEGNWRGDSPGTPVHCQCMIDYEVEED